MQTTTRRNAGRRPVGSIKRVLIETCSARLCLLRFGVIGSKHSNSILDITNSRIVLYAFAGNIFNYNSQEGAPL